MLPSNAERCLRGREVKNQIHWSAGWETHDHVLDMCKGLDSRVTDILFGDIGFRQVAYLQSWDIYIWSEPNESSLLLRNERGE